MKQITFAEFYQECKGKLSFEILRDLNPYQDYFKHEETFIGLQFRPKGIWISIVVGHGVRWFWELKKECVKLGINAVGFVTWPSNAAVNKLAKYFGAELRFLDEKCEATGEQSLEYTIYLDHKRFRGTNG